MIARFDDRAEEKKLRDFIRQRRQAVESFLLFSDEVPYLRFCRKYKIQIPNNRDKHLRNVMDLALKIDCNDLTKKIAERWLEKHGFRRNLNNDKDSTRTNQ